MKRDGRVPDFELSLDGHAALRGVYHTGKLGQQVITRRIDDSASVLLYERLDDCSVGCQDLDGCRFILAHQPAISFDVGTEDGRKLANHASGDTEGRVFTRHHGNSVT